MNDRIKAHGRSAHATLAWLHGRRVKSLSMFAEPSHFGVPEREHVEQACRLLLSVPLGEQLAAGGTAAEHITAARTEVRRALDLAKRLGPGDPVDHLERIYDDLHATLASPRIYHGVGRLAETLIKERVLGGDRVAAVLRAAMIDRSAPKFGPAPVTRRITVVDGPRR
jgi:hypothetical protein